MLDDLPHRYHLVLPKLVQTLNYIVVLDDTNTDSSSNKLTAPGIHLYDVDDKTGLFGEVGEAARTGPYLEKMTLSRDALDGLELQTLTICVLPQLV